MTHGDDFVITGPTEKRKMTSVYPIKSKVTSYGSSKSIKILNRRLHWGEKGIVYQHDPRHVDVLVKDVGFEHGNSVQTPAAPETMEEEESELLSQGQHHRYRSLVARCLFLSQDRADITFIVNESADAEEAHTEGIHAKTESHRKKHRRGRTVRSSTRSVRSKGSPELDA